MRFFVILPFLFSLTSAVALVSPAQRSRAEMESVPWVLISTAEKISFADAWQSTTPGVLREGEKEKVYVINKKTCCVACLDASLESAGTVRAGCVRLNKVWSCIGLAFVADVCWIKGCSKFFMKKTRADDNTHTHKDDAAARTSGQR